MKSKLMSLCVAGVFFGTLAASSAGTLQWSRTNEVSTAYWTNAVMWTVTAGESATGVPGADDLAVFGTQRTGASFTQPLISGAQACKGLRLYLRNDGWSARQLHFNGENDASLTIGESGFAISEGNQWESASSFKSSVAIILAADQAWQHRGSNFDVYSPISGPYTITMTGDSNVMINFANSANTFGGFVQAGGQTIVNANSSIDEDGKIVSGPLGIGRLELRGGTLNTWSARTLHNDVVHTGTITVNNVTFAAADGAGFALADDASDGFQTLSVSGTVRINREITVEDDSNVGLHKTGSGTLILSGTASTYTGPTIVEQGTLRIAGIGALGAAPETFVANQLHLTGGIVQATEDVTFGPTHGIMFAGGGFNVDADKTVTVNSPISGSGALTKQGSGTMIVNLNEDDDTDELVVHVASGVIEINAGEIEDVALAGVSGTGGELVLNATSVTLSGAGTNTCTSAITGDTKIVYAGTGKQVLGGNNTFSGGFEVRSGTVAIQSNQALGTGDFVLSGGTLELEAGSGATQFDVASFTWEAGTIATVLNANTAPIVAEGAFTKAGAGPFVFDFAGTTEEHGTYTLVEFDSTNFAASDFVAINLPEMEEGPLVATFAIEDNVLVVRTNIARATVLIIR